LEDIATLTLGAGDYADRFFISFINREAVALSTETPVFQNDFHVYYNNTFEEIVIQKRNDDQLKSIKVYNLLGQCVLVYTPENPFDNEFTMSTVTLKSAPYVVRLETNQGEFSQKLIVYKN
jgi:hypothetical protein